MFVVLPRIYSVSEKVWLVLFVNSIYIFKSEDICCNKWTQYLGYMLVK